MVRPHMDFTFHSISSHVNTVYVLRTKPGVSAPGPAAGGAVVPGEGGPRGTGVMVPGSASSLNRSADWACMRLYIRREQLIPPVSIDIVVNLVSCQLNSLFEVSWCALELHEEKP